MSANLQRGYNALKEVLDAPIASYFSSCVHCGLCAEACMFYTESGNPKYTPIHKLEPLRRVWFQEATLAGKLMRLVGLAKPGTDELLAEWSPLVYDSCSLCGRCSMVCPVGNDIAYMVRKLREGMAASGNVTMHIGHDHVACPNLAGARLVAKFDGPRSWRVGCCFGHLDPIRPASQASVVSGQPVGSPCVLVRPWASTTRPNDRVRAHQRRSPVVRRRRLPRLVPSPRAPRAAILHSWHPRRQKRWRCCRPATSPTFPAS